MVSLFFVVAAMLEFAFVLLVKRNTKYARIGRQKFSGNESKKYMKTQENRSIKIVVENNNTLTEHPLSYKEFLEEVLKPKSPFIIS